MNAILAAWNGAEASSATDVILACCAARRWAEEMVARRPYTGIESLSLTADEVWSTMDESDWMQAFAAHPRIGERKASSGGSTSGKWSEQEQGSTAVAARQVLSDLSKGNRAYEERFGFTYIVCATGKSADEMLAILQRRLTNDRETELREAAEQQRQIMQIRLGKWLVE